MRNVHCIHCLSTVTLFLILDQLSTNQHWADVSCSWDFDASGENPSLLIV